MNRPPRTPLSADERCALDAFAAAHGRRWKETLRLAWTRAMEDYAQRYPATAAVLQRLRNARSFGSADLIAHRPSPPASDEERLAAYLERPSAVQWEHLAGHAIPGTRATLGQALACVDSATARDAAPAPQAVREAIQTAQEGRFSVPAVVPEHANDAASRRRHRKIPP